MANSFTCKALFGLGITSLVDFIKLMAKYKNVKEVGIVYINAASFSVPGSKQIIVFDSIKEIFRLHTQIKAHHVVVISDSPVLLKEIPDVVPLDFSNNRSFEFNFQEIDPHTVLRSLKGKSTITSKFTNFDNLGYHVNRIKGSGELLNAYLSITSSMPFDKRAILRAAVVKFISDVKPNVKTITSALDKLSKTYIFPKDIDNFNSILIKQYKQYHAAINSDLQTENASKKYEVDRYAVSYFRKLVNQKVINDERIRKNNVKFATQAP